MREGWKIISLGEIATVSAGSSAPQNKELFEGGTHLFVRTSDVGKIRVGLINNSADKLNEKGIKKLKLFPSGTILFPKSGASTFLNHRVILTCNAYVSSHLAAIKAKTQSALDRYLLHYLTTVKAQDLIQDHKYPSLKVSDIQGIEIPLPSIPEQKRIVAILDEAFEGIGRAVANAEKNLANACELFESYLNSVFTQKGEGWVERKLGDVCKNLDSKRIPITKSKRKSGNIPYYGASGIVDYVADFIFDEDLLLVSEDGANLLARTYPIAFSISGKTWVNNHAHVLRFDEISSQRFIEYYLNSISLVPYVSGMAQPKLNQKALNSIPVSLPPADEQRKIVTQLDKLSAETHRFEAIYQQKLTALAELKQSLLHKAFTGELTAKPDTVLKHEAVA
ncbi:restriction endonuclease subunit S [Nitrosococcus watsonii]|uniref:Restriction modification system DNA specificity domain protein n=1 Tax=Nitrosococcus watsoni (strain C-113) TaxID=105559 RepID=D8K996_NITWC|nr:restriction endonuclease subunit S [Nitrosococcus watsonii]ADJ29239.1 restriction modification system DNA specificity domain protein [Nitrosococcus watsonii C-113]